ncbi:MAG TPA: sortase [Jiangellaceae bacterium]|nr:sortase [Jiangellaceae bacterium]
MSGSRRFWLVILLVAGVLGGCAAPDAQPPSRSVEPDPAASRPVEPHPTPSRPAGPDPSATEGPIDIRETNPGAVTPDPVTTPVRLDYPDRDITLEVDPVGVAQDGQMEIPEDADRAGWYRFGPGVGDGKGTVVIAAHNGSFTTGVGPFHYLRQARPGDVIELSGADGTVATYDVVSTASEAKDVIDLAAYFERDGRPTLVLITCGGQWQEDVGSYSDNIVVTANLRQE